MALTISITVAPGSGRIAWHYHKNGTIKCFLKKQAKKGAANKELIKVIAKALKITQLDIEIISGLTSHKKIIKIHTALTRNQFLQTVGIEGTQDQFVSKNRH